MNIGFGVFMIREVVVFFLVEGVVDVVVVGCLVIVNFDLVECWC